MKPNWTICVVSALIDVLQKHHLFTQFTRNLIKNSFFLHHRLNMWWVIGLWNTRSRFPKQQQHENEEECWTRNDWHFIHKLNIAESNLIWVAKKMLFVVVERCWCLIWKEFWMCKEQTLHNRHPKLPRVSRARQKKSVADYLTTNFTFIPFYRQLFIAKIHCHRAPKKNKTMKQVE